MKNEKIKMTMQNLKFLNSSREAQLSWAKRDTKIFNFYFLIFNLCP